MRRPPSVGISFVVENGAAQNGKKRILSCPQLIDFLWVTKYLATFEVVPRLRGNVVKVLVG